MISTILKRVSVVDVVMKVDVVSTKGAEQIAPEALAGTSPLKGCLEVS